MDIRLFKHGLGVKKAFESEYRYKETDTPWQYAFGKVESDKVSYGDSVAVLVSRDILVAKQTNLLRQLVWGNSSVQKEIDHITAFLKEI